MKKMNSIRDIPSFENVRIMVRASLNVEVENGVVLNTFRLRKALPTIQFLQSKGARVILIGHISDTGTETLEPVFKELSKTIKHIAWCPVHKGAEAKKMIEEMDAGSVLVLENLRRDKGEVSNSETFAAAVAELADIFVQDSFDVCHRPHASVIGIPKLLPSYAGFLVEDEIKELSRALKPKRPALAIIGGAKFTTKEPVLKKLLSVYDKVFVGGALANDFIQALGHGVGTSLTSHPDPEAVHALLQNKKLSLPTDAVVAPIQAQATEGHVSSLTEIPADQAILDSGPATSRHLRRLVSGAKTILWNGPLGNYEHGFVAGSEDLAEAIAESKAVSILGGGDTVALVEKANLGSQYTFISTGGGAMLDFIANGTLPGIDALRS